MAKYFSVFILVTSILFLVACTPAAGQPDSVEATFTGQPVVAQPTSTPGATEPSAASTPTFIPSTVPAPVEKMAGALWVKILSPLDNSVVAAAEVDIQGQAPVDTVLSINDEIVQVGSDQKFSARITLDEGINVIEVLASDVSGNEVFIPLTVYYVK